MENKIFYTQPGPGKGLISNNESMSVSLFQAVGAAHTEAVRLEHVDKRQRGEQQLTTPHVRTEPRSGPQQSLAAWRRHGSSDWLTGAHRY